MSMRPEHHLSFKRLKWMILILLFLVWFINGFLFKLLDLVPRHTEIVAHILGKEHANLITKLIGTGEVLISIWVLIGIYGRLSALMQIVLILTMNIIEFMVVPDLLIFGKFNLLFAIGLSVIIYWNEYHFKTKPIGLWAFFKSQPFAVRAHFDFSLVLTFSIPKDQAIKRLPAPLLPDTFDEKHAFLAIAIVKCNGLRPVFFPAFLGQDFYLTGYRIFSKYININNKRLRGLYILQSQTDKELMKYLGKIFTRYQYRTSDVSLEYKNNIGYIRSELSDMEIIFREKGEEIVLPDGSVFPSWKEARRFAGPLPFTFSVDQLKNEILIIEGVRENWNPEPVEILNYKIPYLHGFDAQLASAFMVKNVPYSWKKGKIEQLVEV